MRQASAALVVLLALLPRVASSEEWFDAYARGLEALKATKAERAVQSFERAIRLRPDPGTNLLTYGTNRLDRYHPYLRLAEAHLLAGQPEKAKDALRRSAERGKEPASDRARLAGEVEAALAKMRLAAATPPPTMIAAAPPPTAAPVTTVAQAPAPTPLPSPVAVLPPSPAPAGAARTGRVTSGTRPPVPSARPSALAAEPTPATVAAPAPLPSPDSGVSDAPPGPTLAQEPAAAISPTALAGIALLIVAMGVAVLLRRRRGTEAEPPGRTVALPSRAATPARTMPGSAPRTGTTPRPTRVAPATVSEHGLEDLLEPEETSALTPPTRVAGADRFGDYRLHEQLGKGGMASVFKAERRGEICALKRPLSAFLEDPEFLERFLREAEIGRTLHHPNIIRIFERGEVKGVPYFTMELVKGETLQSYVRRNGALEPKAAARVIAQVAEALDYAHLKGVVHRDLKPSNIMILGDGTVKVMDYGIARARRFEGLTVTGAFLGTPDYVAPETAEGKGTDARSDLYSLGIVFYEILTGKKPFVGDTPFATLRKHCTEPPTPPSLIAPGIPRELEAIILRLLAKDPADRHPGAEELLIAIREFLNRAA